MFIDDPLTPLARRLEEKLIERLRWDTLACCSVDISREKKNSLNVFECIYNIFFFIIIISDACLASIYPLSLTINAGLSVDSNNTDDIYCLCIQSSTHFLQVLFIFSHLVTCLLDPTDLLVDL